jgi:primosomal protein N' (replication factor Y)
MAGEKRVILGARSAIFAPAKNLGLIIVDEEQEGSYKQDQSPRYHAREVARWRAQDLGAILLLGTATPSLETMYRVSTGDVELLSLTKRVDGKILPDVKIIDLKAQEGLARSHFIISPPLRSAIEKALAAKEGILILLNRRGYATHVQCTHCGEVLFCSYCAVPLTFHQDKQEALCHYCNFKTSVLSHCRKCAQPMLQFRGMGTEKIESEIARLFPAAKVARLDRDTVRKRGSHEQILSRFRKGEIDILVGTQMIAKGFDFQHVNVAGIVNADTGLMLPDFRSSERTFQLLTQMAGRTGRGMRSGAVFIQTYSPGHYAIQFASKHESQGFFLEEMKMRRALQYPPLVQLVNVVFRGKIESRAYEQAHQFKKLFQDLSEKEVTLIGPAPMPIYRLRNQFRWHLLLKGGDMTQIQAAIKDILRRFKRKSGVHAAVDVDPIAIL